MKVDKTVETDKGTVKFEGELTEDELNLVIEIGLNVLLANGAIPLVLKQTEDDLAEEEAESEAFDSPIKPILH